MADKKFKLVYEKEGELKGSYSGIPANDDADVIKRTVLEGKEDPVAPTDPTALYHKLVPLDFGEATPSGTEKVYEMSIDAETIMSLHSSYITASFRITYEDREYVVISYGFDEEGIKLINLVDIYADDPNAEEHNTFDLIRVETDADTGDSQVFLIVK